MTGIGGPGPGSDRSTGTPGTTGTEERPFAVAAPRVELPKGGGAIRGVGEKFGANPATGTGSMTVPIATSPGRQGLGPSLSLSYDSGSGNGPFGFGWSLSLPRVARKTDQGLPRYDDAAESDVFVLSGAEDLVPVLGPDSARIEDRSSAPGFLIHRYRPRVEGLFARIERWTRTADGDVHWRSVSADNVLTVYGGDAGSRIADPADPRRIAAWLICQTRDDRGNAVRYDYKAEDGAGVDLAAAHQRNRGGRDDPRRGAARHLKRIRYGNRTPVLDDAGGRPAFLPESDVDWMFEVVLDYGEHDPAIPRPAEDGPWAQRPDPFSSYRTGFEVRTCRRVRRVLMFHHVADEPAVGRDCLVRSTDLDHGDEHGHSFLRSVTQYGYRRDGDGYLRRGLPPVEFTYSVPTVQGTVRNVDDAAGPPYQWVDLHGDGVPGLLTEHAGAWFYRRNTSPVAGDRVEFAPVEVLAAAPVTEGAPRFLDLAGDGKPDVVVFGGTAPGFHRHDPDEGWEPFRPFPAQLTRDPADPRSRFLDVTGDGRADLVVTEDGAFVWHESLAEQGFGPALRVPQPTDEEAGPRLVFADAEQSVHLADLSGDGLTDLVRIRAGEVCYWPNLGHGRFGAKVTMDGAPRLDRPDLFDQGRIRLADVDGSGPIDLLYLGADGVILFANRSGNSWAPGERVAAFPAVDSAADIQVADLMGNGTACLVWTSPLPGNATRPMRYVDLMGGQKPHLLVGVVNNLGAETTVHYAPSTRFAQADRLAGTPWVTRLPFPVHVVERVETVDRIAGNRFTTRYAYHHGYFDGAEREFRGFGLVEQWDTEELDALGPVPTGESSHVPPVLTRTWFHTGAPPAVAGSLEERYRRDYHPSDLLLPDTVLPPGLALDEQREACRALKGAMLHQEVYALDGGERAVHPYVVTEQNLTVRLLQPRAGNRHAVFHTAPREALTVQYERNLDDPRIAHALTLDMDDVGNVLRSAAVGYGRLRPDPALSTADQQRQAARHVTCTENSFTNGVDSADAYRTPLPAESRGHEVTGLRSGPALLGFEELRAAITAAAEIPFEATPAGGVEKRLIQHVRTAYRPDDLGAAQGDPLALLAPGRLESLALPGESYRLALTAGLMAELFGDMVTDGMLSEEARYEQIDGDWWQPSGRAFLSPGTDDDPAAELAHARAHFFQPHRFRDPFHRPGFPTETVLAYDEHALFVRQTRDAVGNLSTAEHDYRVLQPRLLTDPNGNRTEAAFDALGLVVGTAVLGKATESVGDSLADFVADLDEATALSHLDDPLADPAAILGGATTRTVYDLGAYLRAGQPAVACTLARETHESDLAAGERTRVQQALAYSDGFGREIQRKAQAEPDDRGPRWVGSGWTILDNKGQPVRQYEPFFSASSRFEFARVEGVSPIVFYDPVGRVTGTLHPDHTWEKVAFDAWRQETWDRNDTVLLDPLTDGDVADHVRRLPAADYLPGWFEHHAAGGPAGQDAAAKAAEHAGTPALTHLDSLGRVFLTVAHNRTPGPAGPQETFPATRVLLDIQGHQREVVDALGRVVMRYDHDLLGSQLHSASMDAGERWSLADAAGRPLYTWDSRGHRHRSVHDAAGRPTEVWLRTDDGPEQLVGRTTYGETVPAAETHNLRGKPHQVFDTAGVLTTGDYDFTGNPVTSSRRLALDHRTPDWSTTVPLEPTELTTRTTVDALTRPLSQTTPDGSTVRRSYGDDGRLRTVEAELAGTSPVRTAFVTGLHHDARGRRTRIEYGNGVVTDHHHDPVTFRLRRLRTVRDGVPLQDLAYAYDAVGNVTSIEDRAQQPVFFRNVRVPPGSEYRYDATYRLFEATGREHLGQVDGRPAAPAPPRQLGAVHRSPDQPGDGTAMARYREQYDYDAVGNLLAMRHSGTDPAHPGWTRGYHYAEPSLIDADVPGDRLSSTRVGAGIDEVYRYDAHGNTVSMNSVPVLGWNFRDQLEESTRQLVADGDPETTFYVSNGGGQRVRKVTYRAAGPDRAPTRTSERIYLGGLEIHRRYDGAGVAVTLERETLHLLDGERRIAMVETRTVGDDGSAAQLLRYQLGDHLGSTAIELDRSGEVISYEEYHPYGTTAYEAVDARLGAAPKRYRFTGKERDEETGLAYHEARYLAPVLGRWISADPAGLPDGTNRYAYARGNPVLLVDPEGTACDPALQSCLDPPANPAAGGAVHAADGGAATPANPAWELHQVEHLSRMTAAYADYQLYEGGAAGEPARYYRLTAEGELIPTSRLDELSPLPLGPVAFTLHMLRGGPSVMAEQATVDIALGGVARAGAAGVAWVRDFGTFLDDVGAAGLRGAQEGAAESVAGMSPFRPPSAAAAPTIRFIGLGADAQGGPLATVEEITEAAADVGARVMNADAVEALPVNEGRLWLGRYGSGAIPGGRYSGRAGLALLEGYAKSSGGRTGAIYLGDVPRPDWINQITPLIDKADEVMFHVSTGVGVLDEATGIQFLTSEELLYVLNTPAASAKTIFFVIDPF